MTVIIENTLKVQGVMLDLTGRDNYSRKDVTAKQKLMTVVILNSKQETVQITTIISS